MNKAVTVATRRPDTGGCEEEPRDHATPICLQLLRGGEIPSFVPEDGELGAGRRDPAFHPSIVHGVEKLDVARSRYADGHIAVVVWAKHIRRRRR